MRNCLGLTFSFLLLLGLTTVWSGRVDASSRRSSREARAVVQRGTPSNSFPTDVVTYHYNAGRLGLNSLETTLTTSNVNSSSFGKLGLYPVDGKVDAQPLYLNQLNVQGNLHNTLFVVTENDSVYAFDADTGAQLWRVSALGPGETPSDDHGCSQITPQIGITDTPVIDRQQGPNGAIYFVAMTKDSSQNYHQRLHALDLTTGAELFGGPKEIQATYPGSGDGSQGGQVIFAPGQYAERAGLLEYALRLDVRDNYVTIYIAFTSHCDYRPYTGWLMAYDGSTLAQKSVLNLTPNGNEGAIWMAGAGLAADTAGNVYFLDANGTFDTTLNSRGFPVNGDYGNSFIKVSSSTIQGGLAVDDYFAMHNTVQESNADEGLGSGGTMVLPDILDNSQQIHHLAVGAGKDTNIYVVNRDNMGKFNPSNDNAIYQEIDGVTFRGRVGYACLLQQHRLLRLGRRPAGSVQHCERKVVHLSGRTNANVVRLSWNHTQYIRQWNVERNRLGGGERQSGRAACLRCHQPFQRALQQQSGRIARSVWAREQVHHPGDRERQSVRRHPERSGSVRIIALMHQSENRQLLIGGDVDLTVRHHRNQIRVSVADGPRTRNATEKLGYNATGV